MWYIPELSSSPPSLSIIFPFPVSDPVPVPAPVPVSGTALVSVPAPVSVLPPPIPISFPLRPRPHHRSRPRCRCRSLFSVPRTWLPLRYNVCAQTPGRANGAVGCPRAPLPVCRDGNACGMKVPAVKQKRTAAKDVLLPFPPSDGGTR